MTKQYEQLHRFREEVYCLFQGSADATFELIDAIASTPRACSAVDVSMSSLMQRKYASVYKALQRTTINELGLTKLLVTTADKTGALTFNGYQIEALDCSSMPRREAKTLTDRGMVREDESNVPGHQYSILGRVMYEHEAWIGVRSCLRVPTSKTPITVGCEQIALLREHSEHKHIITADSGYHMGAELLGQVCANIQLLVRLRGGRRAYKRPLAQPKSKVGAKPIDGPLMHFNKPETYPTPAQSHRIVQAQDGYVEILVFDQMHFAQLAAYEGCIVRVQSFSAAGKPIHKRPIWLFWSGEPDLDWPLFWRVYLKRFCIESLHQFAKNSLGWTSHRLAHTEREETWSWLVMLAYWMLLLASTEAPDCPKPWQKKQRPNRPLTPARTQAAYLHVFAIIGTPAAPPKLRGSSPGRAAGFRPTPRMRHPVIVKT